jgi:hypothetical protein
MRLSCEFYVQIRTCQEKREQKQFYRKNFLKFDAVNNKSTQ